MARALAGSGARILVLERGDFIAQEDHNWNPDSVWKQLRYRTTETWLDEAGQAFRPYTHYCVGGNTKFWGTVLYRLRREDFKAIEHVGGISPAWPIDYETLEPYYERAERIYNVHGQHGIDPDRAGARALSVSAGAALRRRAAHRRSAAAAGAASIAAAAGPARELHPVQHLQFVPVQDPREKRCGCVRHQAGRRSGRDVVDPREGPPLVHRRKRHAHRGGGGRARRARPSASRRRW